MARYIGGSAVSRRAEITAHVDACETFRSTVAAAVRAERSAESPDEGELELRTQAGLAAIRDRCSMRRASASVRASRSATATSTACCG